MFVFLLILLCIFIFVEGTLTSLPLVLVCLLCLMIMKRDESVFILAMIAGLLLDILSLRPLGSTCLFFIIFVFLLLLYQRKYEIDSYPFVGFSAFCGTLLFLAIFGEGNIVLESLMSTCIGLVLFAGTRLTIRQRKEAKII